MKRSLLTIILCLALAGLVDQQAAAAEESAPPAAEAQPATPEPTAAAAGESESAPGDAPAQQDSPAVARATPEFRPSEQITVDNSVPYPVDM